MKLLVTSEWQYWMIQVRRGNDSALNQSFQLNTDFYVFACVAHLNDWMTYRKFIIFNYVGIQAHYIAILD